MAEKKFIQVRSDHGYLIHAVPADASRHEGIVHFSWAKPVCGKVKGRDAWCAPTLRILRKDGEDLLFTGVAPAEGYCETCADHVAFSMEPLAFVRGESARHNQKRAQGTTSLAFE